MLKIVISNSLFNPYIPFASLVQHLIQTCTTSRSLRVHDNLSRPGPLRVIDFTRPVYNLPRHYILPMVTKIFTYMYGLNASAGNPAEAFPPCRYEKISSDHV